MESPRTYLALPPLEVYAVEILAQTERGHDTNMSSATCDRRTLSSNERPVREGNRRQWLRGMRLCYRRRHKKAIKRGVSGREAHAVCLFMQKTKSGQVHPKLLAGLPLEVLPRTKGAFKPPRAPPW